jgi:Tol biopolymer transport system component
LNLETGEEVAIDTSAARTNDPAISPNGRYIAYSIDDTAENVVSENQRVYIRSFPDPDRLFFQVVEDRADDPFWSLEGDYLYYRNGGSLMRIGVNTGQNFSLTSSPEDVTSFPGNTIRTAVHPTDGRLLIVHPGAALQTMDAMHVEVILSFSRYLDELFVEDD